MKTYITVVITFVLTVALLQVKDYFDSLPKVVISNIPSIKDKELVIHKITYKIKGSADTSDTFYVSDKDFYFFVGDYNDTEIFDVSWATLEFDMKYRHNEITYKK